MLRVPLCRVVKCCPVCLDYANGFDRVCVGVHATFEGHVRLIIVMACSHCRCLCDHAEHVSHG